MNTTHGENTALLQKKLKKCPFCGHKIQDVIDSVHKTGIYWSYNPELDVKLFGTDCQMKHYSAKQTDNPCYRITCLETEGGCSASIDGDTLEEVIDKWNTRHEAKTDKT